jgi:hypothetical protein
MILENLQLTAGNPTNRLVAAAAAALAFGLFVFSSLFETRDVKTALKAAAEAVDAGRPFPKMTFEGR